MKAIPVPDGGWDHILFSRQETKKAGAIYENVGKVYDIGDSIASAVGKDVAGPPCKLAKTAVDHISDHADECDKKGQCLRLEAYSVPDCVRKGREGGWMLFGESGDVGGSVIRVGWLPKRVSVWRPPLLFLMMSLKRHYPGWTMRQVGGLFVPYLLRYWPFS